MSKVPVGFCFQPTVQELVYYLRRKVKGETLPTLLHDLLHECNIYGHKEPWKIFDKNSKETFYVFTKLKKRSNSKIERIAGCGTWDGRLTNEVKDHSDKLIGFDKYFVFEIEDDLRTNTEINEHWIMHEFSLEEFNDNVICVIRNKDSKKNLEGDQTNNTDEQIRATKPHARKQGNGSQRSKKRNLNPNQKNQKQKKMQNTSTMDNIDVQEKKKIGDSCLLPSNLISEPIKKLEPESSLNLANPFKEEDIMAPYLPKPNLITKPTPFQYVYMESTSSPYDNCTADEFGKDLKISCTMEPFFLQPNVEPIPTKEWTPMMQDFDPKNRDEDLLSYCDQAPRLVQLFL